eukprot:359141-Chlamydomonas_euryale.AAC.3
MPTHARAVDSCGASGHAQERAAGGVSTPALLHGGGGGAPPGEQGHGQGAAVSGPVLHNVRC